MRRKIFSLFIGIILTTLISNASFAFDPQTDCAGFTTTVTNVADIKNALSNAQQKDNSYVVCFASASSIETNETLVIAGKDKPFFINGLSLKPEVLWNPLTQIDEAFRGPLVSVAGSNVTLQNLVLEKKTKERTGITYWPTSALSITGSNVSVIDSELHASQTGIAIGTAEKAADNISIAGTTVVGNISAASKGVFVDNARSVSIAGSFDDAIYGVYIKSAIVVNISDATFRVMDISKAIFKEDSATLALDTNLIGKVLNDRGEKVTRLAGKAPACEGSLQVYTYDPVPPVIGDPFSLTNKATTSITKLADKDRLCFKKSNTVKEYGSTDECVASGDCVCLATGDCVFDFASADINAEHNAMLVFSYSSGEMLNPSVPISLSSLPNVSVIIAPPVDTPVPITGVTDPTHTYTGAGPISETAEIPDGDGRMTTAALESGGGAKGTSMSAGAAKMSCGLSAGGARPRNAAVMLAIAGFGFVLVVFRRRATAT